VYLVTSEAYPKEITSEFDGMHFDFKHWAETDFSYLTVDTASLVKILM
jgi:hypothetical protein